METTVRLKQLENELLATQKELYSEKVHSKNLTRMWIQAISEREESRRKYDNAIKTIVLIAIITISLMFSILFI